MDSLVAGGFQASDYDGIVVLEAESEEKIKEVFSDQSYLDHLAPDEEKFSERTTFRVMSVSSRTVLDQSPEEARKNQ